MLQLKIRYLTERGRFASEKKDFENVRALKDYCEKRKYHFAKKYDSIRHAVVDARHIDDVNPAWLKDCVQNVQNASPYDLTLHN